MVIKKYCYFCESAVLFSLLYPKSKLFNGTVYTFYFLVCCLVTLQAWDVKDVLHLKMKQFSLVHSKVQTLRWHCVFLLLFHMLTRYTSSLGCKECSPFENEAMLSKTLWSSSSRCSIFCLGEKKRKSSCTICRKLFCFCSFPEFHA